MLKSVEIHVLRWYNPEYQFNSKGSVMKKCRKITTVILLVSLAFFFCRGGIVLAQERIKALDDDKAAHMMGDLAVMRPLGIAATAVGAVFYVLSLPFSLAGGNEPEARQKLMADPAGYTFSRPLGEF